MSNLSEELESSAWAVEAGLEDFTGCVASTQALMELFGDAVHEIDAGNLYPDDADDTPKDAKQISVAEWLEINLRGNYYTNHLEMIDALEDVDDRITHINALEDLEKTEGVQAVSVLLEEAIDQLQYYLDSCPPNILEIVV